MTLVDLRNFSLSVLLILFIGLGNTLNTQATSIFPTAKKGVLDLRDWNFQSNDTLEITGEWEFYWKKFLDPSNSRETAGNAALIPFPSTWLGVHHEGDVLGKYGHATYRLRILLPENTPDLALYLRRVQDAYRIYINGKHWMQAGVPAKTSENAIPNITREYSVLKDVSGEIEILAHVSNFSSYAGGGFFGSFTIGLEQQIYLSHLTDLSMDLFLCGALICLGLFMVTLHIGRFQEKAYFVLYTMSFVAAVYVVTSNATLSIIFPQIPYHWTERLAYICGAFLIALTYEFIHQVHDRKTSHLLSTIILYLAAVISICVIFWPKGLPVTLIYALAILLLIVTISCLIEVRYMMKNKVQGRWLLTIGVLVLVLTSIHDLLNANGIILSIYLGQIGMLVLLLFYAAILAFRVNTSIIQNERLAKAIWSMNDSVAIFDNRDLAVIWNDAYLRHLSKPAQDILKPGTPFIDLVRADAFSNELQSANGREQDYIRERMQRHYTPGKAFEMKRNNGWYLYREAETPDGGRITLAADLSTQKAKEAELQSALEELVAANEAKNSFLSNMSHELRTPLNAINGFSEMMVKEVLGKLSVQYLEYAGHINRSGKHLLRLVTDMLDVARIETGKLHITPEEFELSGLLDDCVRMELEKLEAQKLTFRQSIPDALSPLYADPVRVRQIVLNLLDNAIKFTEAGGHVSLNVETDINGAIAISVHDTGIGIAAENIETALQKFGQVRQSHLNAHEGLGLGLSIAHVIMELHGGTLELKSQLGEGTIVTATFLPSTKAKLFFE